VCAFPWCSLTCNHAWVITRHGWTGLVIKTLPAVPCLDAGGDLICGWGWAWPWLDQLPLLLSLLLLDACPTPPARSAPPCAHLVLLCDHLDMVRSRWCVEWFLELFLMFCGFCVWCNAQLYRCLLQHQVVARHCSYLYHFRFLEVLIAHWYSSNAFVCEQCACLPHPPWPEIFCSEVAEDRHGLGHVYQQWTILFNLPLGNSTCVLFSMRAFIMQVSGKEEEKRRRILRKYSLGFSYFLCYVHL
jgi:hypothetical protein